ncbi:MAG: hypothetical protein P1V20_30310 [Verrucomicrobiales bacterium]|nr:hypothetical protein [Verrucomicrobiales bacterium]
MKLLLTILILTSTGMWISSHFRFLSFGLELPFGAIGIGAERGSLLVVKGTKTDAVFKPFLELLDYESYLGSPPEFFETLKGTFAVGKHPVFPWVVGVRIPFWIICILVVAVPVGVMAIRRKHTPA